MIKFEDVSFKYSGENNKYILKDINLEIKKGEIVLITGASGCGKTTILRLINGLIPHYYEGDLEGNVTVNDKTVAENSIYSIGRDVGSVFQNPRSQFFNVDTTSELAFSLENQGVNKEKIKNKISSTVHNYNLYKLMDRNIFKLSGGEKQKIACASVSVADTDIVVLDEPSSNLDVASIDMLRKVISFWKKQGKTVVIVEHRIYFMRNIADRVLIMKDGKISEDIGHEDLNKFDEINTSDIGLRTWKSPEIDDKLVDINYNNESETYRVKNFKFLYNDKKHGIEIMDFSLFGGEIIALFGNNGAGKTTFCNCLCGLNKKFKGNLCKNGCNYRNKDRLKMCYMVMQDVNHQLFTESVLEEVLLSMRYDKRSDQEKKKSAEKILDGLSLSAYKDEHPMSLSGGQKQRVAIASAIASDREIIVLDEPTSGLDYGHMIQVSNLLKKLKEKNKTVIVVTHDIELINSCCDRIIRI